MQIVAKTDVPQDMLPRMAQQIPYITMVALNATAFDARDAVRGELPRRFKLKNTYTASRILVDKASKAALEAAVTAPDYMAKQEYGGTVKPMGKHLAAPEFKRGKILRQAQRPKAMLDKPRTFILKTKGHVMIAQRVGKKRYPLRILFWLTGSQQFEKRFDMALTVDQAVHTHFPTRFAQAWARAVDTGR